MLVAEEVQAEPVEPDGTALTGEGEFLDQLVGLLDAPGRVVVGCPGFIQIKRLGRIELAAQ